MIRSSFEAVRLLNTNYLLSSLNFSNHSRAASVGTAIYRGIRRSKSSSSGERLTYRQNGDYESDIRDDVWQEREISGHMRRPNHQQMQDVEDIEESRWLKQSRITPRQMRYRQGGRPSFERDFSREQPSPFEGTMGRHKAGSYGGGQSREGAELGQRSSGREYRNIVLANQPDAPEFEFSTQNSEPEAAEPFKPIVYEDQAFNKKSDWRSPHKEELTLRSIPYTTSASEFLYGTSVVYAALKIARRKLYKLYIVQESQDSSIVDSRIKKLARLRGVSITMLAKMEVSLLDKLANGRPHNGYMLEASPLPKLPVVGFNPVPGPQGHFRLALDHQTNEDEIVNGKNEVIKYQAGYSRYPFVVMLDSILDPGNFGAILRSAYFLGADAVVIANRNCAPLSPVTLKASAGAAEAVPLVSVNHPNAFVNNCKENGWKLYAAVAQPSRNSASRIPCHLVSELGSPLSNHPAILMLGGEGQGLRKRLHDKADAEVTIEGHKQRLQQNKFIMDSLNVSVAAAILITVFLRQPYPNKVGTARKVFQEAVESEGNKETDDPGEEGTGKEAVVKTDLFQI